MTINKLTAMGAAIIAIAGIGIGTAAGAGTAAKGVKACVTKGGYLQTATNGKCPAHTAKVTIAKRGPRGKTGPQGPGARVLTIDTDAADVTKTATLPAGEKVTLNCHNTDAGYGQVTLTVTPPNTALTRIDGSIDVRSGTPGYATFQFSSSAVLFDDDNAGSAPMDYTAKGAWTISFSGQIPASQTSNLVVQLLVVRGGSSFTLDLIGRTNYSSQNDSCGASVQLTPAS